MIDSEKAYIAGIIDGEGSIMLQKIHANEYPAPCISIASTTLELLNWIKERVGKGTIRKKKNYNLDKHKNCYSYILRHNDAIALLKEVYPYLVIETKRKRAELILTKYKSLTPRNGHYTKKMKIAKENFYINFMAIK